MSACVVHRCRLFDYKPCAIQCMSASQTSDDLAVARSDGSIEVWSTTNCWFQKLVIPGSSDRSVESLTWIENRLMSGGLDGDITEYDLSNATIKFSVDSYGGAVWCIAYSVIQDKIAVGCEDGSVKIFDTKNKAVTFERAFDKQEGRILSMSWHESGDVIATASVDIIRIWSTKTGHAIQRITIEREMKKVETIVWSLLFLRDYTIVSGDSYGRVQFWNSKDGTLVQSHRVHKADVLCLCPSRDERCIYASGVDPRVCGFNLLSDEDPTSWVRGQALQRHTHDVRAIALVRNMLVSGGVDTNLLMNALSGNSNRFQRVFSFPTKPLVSVSPSKKLVLFQHSNYLDVWKLAKFNMVSELQPGRNVAIEEQPIKLLQIKLPKSNQDNISCSCISSCGIWVAYSTASALRLYKLQTDDSAVSCKINRVHCVGLVPSHCLVFTPNSKYLIASASNHKILIVKLDADAGEARLLQMLHLKAYTSVTHLLAVSSNSTYLGTANLEGEINVFDITNMTHFCTLPTYSNIPTSLAFHPITHDLMTAYDDLQVFEYSLNKKAYTAWTKECMISTREPLLQVLHENVNRHSCNVAIVTGIGYLTTDEKETVYFMSREGLFVVERTPAQYESQQSHLNARFCSKFKPLLCAKVVDENTLFVVERPMQDIWDQLPPTLYQKKFGT